MFSSNYIVITTVFSKTIILRVHLTCVILSFFSNSLDEKKKGCPILCKISFSLTLLKPEVINPLRLDTRTHFVE